MTAQGVRDAILQVKDVVKRFGGVIAVDGCSLSVQRGTITGLIGPNGAGKTTLFNLIAGVYHPDAGDIRFEGQRIDYLPPQKIFARQIGRTFQLSRELKRLTVLDNLMIVPEQQAGERFWNVWLQPRRVRRQETAIRERAEAVLHTVGLHRLRYEYAGNLSGGQKKLLELARMMMSNALLILLDEPAAGVNPTLMRDLVKHIQEMQEQGRTFLLIEHDIDLVMELCDPVIVMSQGHILIEGTPQEVRQDPRVIAAYLGA